MNLRTKPYKIDFIGNKPEYIVKTSPFHTEGRRYKRTFALSALTSNSTLNIYTPHGNYTWNILSSSHPDEVWTIGPASTKSAVLEQLNNKVVNNYSLRTHYDVSIEQRINDVVVTLTALDPNEEEYVTMAIGQTNVTVVETITGISRISKEGYKIVAWYDVDGKSTPKLYFDDNAGSVRIGTDMLKAYFGTPDIPNISDNIADSCGKLLLNARLMFAEMIDGEVGVVKTSPITTLVNGTIQPYCAANNIPDWNSASGRKFILQSGIDIFGQDNGDTIKTDICTEQYLYVANFSNTDISNVPLAITSMDMDGEDIHTITFLTFPSNTVMRISVGAEALGLGSNPGLLCYSASITHGSTAIVRKFSIVPRHYNARTFLLENHVGVYESFVFNNIAMEKSTNGERSVIHDIERYILDDSNRKFTARTGRRTAKELRILEDALDKDNNLLLDGQYAWRISIVPGSYIVLDEEEDLTEVEMQFVLTEKINRKPQIISLIAPLTQISRTDNIIK